MMDDLIAFMPSTDMPLELEPELPQRVDSGMDGEVEPTEHHISLFFRNVDEQWQLLRPYLISHLNEGEPVIYLQHSTSPEQLMDRLRAEGLPLHQLIAQGLLRVLPPSQSYLLPGRFESQKMLEFIETAILEAFKRGYKRIFLTGEMTWSLPNTLGAEEMMKYEALLNPLVDKYPGVTIICQYDLRRFNGADILDALLTHPSILIAGGKARGFYGI